MSDPALKLSEIQRQWNREAVDDAIDDLRGGLEKLHELAASNSPWSDPIARGKAATSWWHAAALSVAEIEKFGRDLE